MKISAALLLAGVISSTLASLSSVAAGGCVTTAISQRDQCLCGCIRSGYDCETGGDLMIFPTDGELKDRCKTAIVAGGPCRWDPNAERSDGSSCAASCPSTTLCGGSGVDPPAPTPDVDRCGGITCTDADGDCPGSCCVKRGGTCGGSKRIRH
mmetsp:Transcript_25106/g.38935  ORF Transcript_25106/g.38935 Transcript_25106/m.38935 type:complete len:153 (+) Transcript_25106:56-514(+)